MKSIFVSKEKLYDFTIGRKCHHEILNEVMPVGKPPCDHLDIFVFIFNIHMK